LFQYDLRRYASEKKDFAQCIHAHEGECEPLYDFQQLSPADFEDLTRDLLQEEWGVRLETFKTGRDQGIDLRYAAVPGESTIIQCKHYAGSSAAKLVRDLGTKERPKIERLAPTRYVLVTSLPLNPAEKSKLLAVLHRFAQGPQDVFGANDLNNLLGRHSTVEERHFKLWMSSTTVLQQVMHNATRVQTEFDVQRVLRNIPLYVQTSNYARALQMLTDHRVVIISGPPGIGKSTLADMLLFAHLEANYQPIIVKADIKEAKDVLRTDRLQVFYFDDFLGQTFLGHRFDFLGKQEDAIILSFIEQVARSKHARFILTTREHILRHAMQISEHFLRRRVALAQENLVLELGAYTLLDRARILYNHIYCSDLARPYKAALLRDEFYLRIIKHRNFNPRLIEWLSRFTNIKSIPPRAYQREVWRILENPEELWRMSFEQQISEAARSVLLALYTLGGDAELSVLHDAWKPLHEYRARKYNCSWSAQDWRQALHDLEGGFLAYDDDRARFINPSVKDFLDSTLSTDREHLEDVLATTREFTQVVTIWSLALSEKGSALQEYFRDSPTRLLHAASQRLFDEHESRPQWGRAHITRPEARLSTMVSIADHTRAEALYQAAATYADTLMSFWHRFAPDCKLAAGILRDLDTARWSKLRNCDLHATIKAALLKSLTPYPYSEDLAAMAAYAEDGDRWNDEDRQRLTNALKRYLDGGFGTELREASSEGELYELRERLETLSRWSGVAMEHECAMVQDRIAELAAESEEGDDPPVRAGGTQQPVGPQDVQEAEVRRLFDGLR
jgi:hypothetical protein